MEAHAETHAKAHIHVGGSKISWTWEIFVSKYFCSSVLIIIGGGLCCKDNSYCIRYTWYNIETLV